MLLVVEVLPLADEAVLVQVKHFHIVFYLLACVGLPRWQPKFFRVLLHLAVVDEEVLVGVSVLEVV